MSKDKMQVIELRTVIEELGLQDAWDRVQKYFKERREQAEQPNSEQQPTNEN